MFSLNRNSLGQSLRVKDEDVDAKRYLGDLKDEYDSLNKNIYLPLHFEEAKYIQVIPYEDGWVTVQLKNVDPRSQRQK